MINVGSPRPASLDPDHARPSCCSCSDAGRSRRSAPARAVGRLGTIGLVAITSHLVPADPNVNAVILLIGLAVGVDYSLFYIRRGARNVQQGVSPRGAQVAAATSGRSVLISGSRC